MPATSSTAKINWYKTPITKEQLRELTKRSGPERVGTRPRRFY